ncbi:MAG: electron transfer flavoprotein subunit beta/FixA family protein [Syntrophothermus sp.]
MNIVVCVKQTFDTEAKIVLDANGQISSQGVNLIINPYDEFAVEEALRIKEKQGSGEVIVVGMGNGPKAQDALRQALAMGADRAILLTDPVFDGSDEYAAANALAKAISGLQYDLILAGWRAIDDGSAQVASRLAEILGIPQVTVVTKLEVDGGKATAYREIDGGSEVVEVPLPAVITAQKGLNEPRYPSLQGIMKAKKKELKQVSAQELGIDTGLVGKAGAKVQSRKFYLPPAKAGAKIIPGEAPEAAAKLAQLLRSEAKVV